MSDRLDLNGLAQSAVLYIQRMLNRHAKLSLPLVEDGLAGPKTRAAYEKASDQWHQRYAPTKWFVAAKGDKLLHLDLGVLEPEVTQRMFANRTALVPGVGGKFLPRGVMIHHTAGPRGRSDGAIPVKRFSEGQRDIPGPLAHFVIGRAGTIYHVSNGRANHAGFGHETKYVPFGTPEFFERKIGEDNTSGNTFLYGIEIDHSGAADEEWSVASYLTAARLTAAICRLWGWDAWRVLGHYEWTKRKVDPDIDMHAFRDIVHRYITSGPNTVVHVTKVMRKR